MGSSGLPQGESLLLDIPMCQQPLLHPALFFSRTEPLTTRGHAVSLTLYPSLPTLALRPAVHVNSSHTHTCILPATHMQSHTLLCSYLDVSAHSFKQSTPRHADHMHLLPDARVWSRIHLRVQTPPPSASVIDCQSWKLLSFLFASPPALSPSLCLSPQPSACPWPEPCPLRLSPGRRCCHYQGSRLSDTESTQP